MSVQGLMAWIRSNGIPIVKGQASRAKTLLPQADKIWDAIHNDTMPGKPKPIKVPQVREDLERMNYENLARWLRSQATRYLLFGTRKKWYVGLRNSGISRNRVRVSTVLLLRKTRNLRLNNDC
jgi:hypothetical protein